MKKFMMISLLSLFVAILLLSCKALSDNSTQSDLDETTKKSVCPVLPETFKESDLIGTWTANYSSRDKDVLIINKNGTYKQIYESPAADLYYESEWQEWWIEYRDSGYIRIHLKGMRRADLDESTFNREDGGIDPDVIWAIDYCEDEEVSMPDEIVLIVTGTKYDVPRGIILRQTRLAGAQSTNSFHLVDEKTP